VWNVFITTICSVSWLHDSNISPVTLAQLPSLHLHSFRRDSFNDDPSGNPTDVFPYVDACYSLWSSRTINMIDIFFFFFDSSCAFIQFRLPHAVIAILDDRHSFANFTRSHTHFDHKKGSQIILYSSEFFQWKRKDKQTTELSLLKEHSTLITNTLNQLKLAFSSLYNSAVYQA
jgi:hypothetical protein